MVGKFPKDGQALHFDDKSISIQSRSDTEKANSDKAVPSKGRSLEQALTFGLADIDAEAGVQDRFQLHTI